MPYLFMLVAALLFFAFEFGRLRGTAQERDRVTKIFDEFLEDMKEFWKDKDAN